MSGRVRTLSTRGRTVSRGGGITNRALSRRTRAESTTGGKRFGRAAEGTGVAPGTIIAPGDARVGRENTVLSGTRGRIVSGNGAAGGRFGSGAPVGG